MQDWGLQFRSRGTSGPWFQDPSPDCRAFKNSVSDNSFQQKRFEKGVSRTAFQEERLF
jgi:hypothetical protein